MASYAQRAVEIISAAKRLAEERRKELPDYAERRAYEFGFDDGLAGKPAEAERDTSDWERPGWCPARYGEGYTFGALVRRVAREEHAIARPNKVADRPEDPQWMRCHRPADARYRNGSTEHDDTYSRILMDLPETKIGGITARWWEGCIGCGAIRPVDEYQGGTVKWRAWRWPESEPAAETQMAIAL